MEKVYIGTKIIKATPMNELDWFKSRGDNVLLEEDRYGYRVTDEDGYVSWSPKDVFERAYREVTEAEKGLLQERFAVVPRVLLRLRGACSE